MSRTLACLSITLLAGAGLSGVATAQTVGQDSTPLEEIARRMPVAEGAGLRLVSVRCTSFYISASAMEKEDRPALAIQYEENAELFLAKALGVSREDREILIGHLTRLSRMYYLLAQSARDSTGDMFDHPLMRADLGFCMRLARQAALPRHAARRPV